MLRSMTDNDLEMVLKWRNLPEVRQMMFTQHEISWNEHQTWWNKAKQDQTKCWLIYSCNSVDVGVVYFYDIDRKNNCGDWGFYLGDDKLFQNININKVMAWFLLEKEAINFAREELKLSKLICEVLDNNESVRKFNEHMGFEKIEDKQTNSKNPATTYQLILSRTNKVG